MIALAVAVSAPLCGCRSHVVVNGRSCAMLTDREVQELVVFARATLAKNSPRHASAEELAEICSTIGNANDTIDAKKALIDELKNKDKAE